MTIEAHTTNLSFGILSKIKDTFGMEHGLFVDKISNSPALTIYCRARRTCAFTKKITPVARDRAETNKNKNYRKNNEENSPRSSRFS